MNNQFSKRCLLKCIQLQNEALRSYNGYLAKSSQPVQQPINPQNLPPLPIPKLENTVQKLIRSSEPFATHCELENFKDMSQKFVQNEGVSLQKYLINRAETTPNWLDEWYQKCVFLNNRDSLPMNTSPVLIFPEQKFLTQCDQIDYVVKLILGVLTFRKICLDNRLPVETKGRNSLDMSVYSKIFAFTRSPKTGCDTVVEHSDSKHIIVLFKNNLHRLQVLNNRGGFLSYYQLLTRLEEMVFNGHTKGEPFGILTAEKRHKWAKSAQLLSSLGDNQNHLNAINKALFAVCIDDAPSDLPCSNNMKLNGIQNGFHGHGPEVNGANRWYDKTLQFFVSRNGCSGIIFEQSSVDPIPLGKMSDFIISYMEGKRWMNVPFTEINDKGTKLELVSSAEIRNDMQEANIHLQNKLENFACELIHFDQYGKEFCKEHNINSNGLIQTALQLAYSQTHGKIVPQEERATTRMFNLGRNDVIRSCTSEVLSFVDAISKNALSLREKNQLLRKAVNTHHKMYKDVMEGKGIDCHIFGLMMACRETGNLLPRFFQSIAFRKSGKYRIISSKNPMMRNSFMCFPPGCNGGYGVCYNPRAEDINVCVSCRKNDPEADAKNFIESWCDSMKLCFDILLREDKKIEHCKD